MRAFVLPSLLIAALAGYGATTAAARKTTGGSGHWEVVRVLDEAFGHTANLRSGKGVCRQGHARRPNLPTTFHVAGGETVAEDGSGSVKANGLAPREGRFSLAGSWGDGNVGTWNQRWQGECGWEADRYQTAQDGTAHLTITTDRHLSLDLDFATGRSGHGTIVNAKGLTAKIEWDNQGDGTITWVDGAVQTFENWTL